MSCSLYIKRCIALAKKGLGYTYPNPMVGCVIVHRGKIIAEGWHKKAGRSHAEREAISKVKDPLLLSKSTLYVNLEPCDHHGKTPPCSDLIIENKIPRVVIGCLDQNKKVLGKGVKKLEDNGCDVKFGVLDSECQNLNRRFFTFHQKKRPYVILKWAESADGFIAPKKLYKDFWLTDNLSKQRVHQWRSQEQSVMIGVQTALIDNPQLNTRLWFGNHPLPIIIDPHQKFAKSEKDLKLKKKKFFTIMDEKIEEDEEKFIIPVKDILNQLFEKEIQSVLIEGGTKTLQPFIDANLYDEARIFRTNVKLREGLVAPKMNQNLISFSKKIKNDKLLIVYRD